jgi:hypothetical protein
MSVNSESKHNELWALLVGSQVLKSDKVLVQKLRDMKVRHAEVIVSMQGGVVAGY